MNATDDTCPRCGGAFHCGAADAAPCPCSTVTVAPALLAELRQRYTGCLCLACLAELAAGPWPPEDQPFGHRVGGR